MGSEDRLFHRALSRRPGESREDWCALARRLHGQRLAPVEPHLARRGTPHGSSLGVFRWPVERTLGWLHQFRRLGYRRDRLPNVHQAFLTLGCCLIAMRFL